MYHVYPYRMMSIRVPQRSSRYRSGVTTVPMRVMSQIAPLILMHLLLHAPGEPHVSTHSHHKHLIKASIDWSRDSELMFLVFPYQGSVADVAPVQIVTEVGCHLTGGVDAHCHHHGDGHHHQGDALPHHLGVGGK